MPTQKSEVADSVAGCLVTLRVEINDVPMCERVPNRSEDGVRILRHCRAVMTPEARLLIVEQILEPDPTLGRKTSYLVDMQMMAMFGSARERTQVEFGEILAQSGLSQLRLIPTSSPVWIIEAGLS